MKGAPVAITRAAVEAEVVSELGPLMSLAAKSMLTNGSNPDLNGPLAFVLQALLLEVFLLFALQANHLSDGASALVRQDIDDEAADTWT